MSLFSFQKPISTPDAAQPDTTEADAIPKMYSNPENGWDDDMAQAVNVGSAPKAQSLMLPVPIAPTAPVSVGNKPPGTPPAGKEPRANLT